MKLYIKAWIKFNNVIDYFYDRGFDLKLGIKTAGNKSLDKCNITHPNKIYGRMYQPTRYRILKRVFKNLPKDLSGFNFIDLGMGKGRALLFASQYNLNKIIGIDFAKDLYTDSCQNLKKFKNKFCDRRSIHYLHCKDITEFTPPNGPNIYFFFDPFKNNLLRKVLEKISKNNNTLKSDLFIYVNPRREFIFNLYGKNIVKNLENLDFNRTIHFYRDFSQYENKPHPEFQFGDEYFF